ncbi:MAG: electron transfer flavoprotein subunit beta/FixA family protein [Deltaproteobacteria bacterium]|nr:electron transfer flavoprotein subunit beta/FixA family protein [Deltaproteobacteria bacterium]
MNIVVFTKRVAAAQEEELKIVRDGEDLDISKLPFKVNDWDNYAVEEAVKTVEKFGGQVTAISLGDKESDEVLRRSIAMGAKEGLLIRKDDPIFDPAVRANVAFNFIKKHNIVFDAIFTGVQAEDDQFGVFGGYLAALLKIPFASMVIGIDEWKTDHVVVKRELEGGMSERVRIGIPCVLSIQTGINEPRYVSIMGIRKASQVERKVFDGSEYMENIRSSIELLRWSYPPKKEGAKLLSADIDSACRELLEILKEKGVYQ